ncbi:uncharacterized protein F5891DRAFT_978213 [Suillus fuscotomentosus]|uniref:Uncharacterized protein n=1 Tax=Suillus fuscotomentosus TaxID=1912939 RepID=A0AAD4EBP5_9AGAM|nr:uncharacterized protein F5891DRAFT_978213 [Suillus fuscotomentosus]KAG1903187.1 hypothetical protein F5891DRAFT_978213 [Suillus fuscotomentosus]
MIKFLLLIFTSNDNRIALASDESLFDIDSPKLSSSSESLAAATGACLALLKNSLSFSSRNYAVGGTGTLPFMPQVLLLQLHLCDLDGVDEHKKAFCSKAKVAPLLCCDSKTSFFWHMEHYVEELSKQFHPYFKKLLPVALEWYHLMREPMKVTFDDVIEMLERHITNLPMNQPSPELLASRWLLKGLKAEHLASSGKEGESQSLVDETSHNNK